ncbi:nitrite reductase (NADH) small subunit [Novimethylophilus kurashikiensis]|uniref:Nitrite reductase (NADH) small subunit n=1 Tax=Novimethylophilus kurashikiensis TaxID=1825523 RepID=A0A2R5FHT2_9PROT|nr:nitrite reductase small subunit NirD [Novimethylophilus kurashikiensis]GBG15863.1 nitrite reductase (NADH) small subunit [Novimethylophilus kurashikiensis]
MSNWTKIANLEDIPRLGSRVVKRNGQADIAVFRTEDDQVFALHDKCPHKNGPLSQGIVHGHKVTCPLHGWNIQLADGNAIAPDEGHAPCVAVKLENGEVFLDV